MTFYAKNPLIIPEVDSSSSRPMSGTRGLYAGSDGWHDINSLGKESKIGGRSATYYIGTEDTPDNINLDFICKNENGSRFNDIIDKIMVEIKQNQKLAGSKIVVRNGVYYQNDTVKITQKCIIEFENKFDFDPKSEGISDWSINTNNCTFVNLKIHGNCNILGGINIFDNCTFSDPVTLGMMGYIGTHNTGSNNVFRFCKFQTDVQVGDPNANSWDATGGNQNSFIGCNFVYGNLLLSGRENIVNNCHFANYEYGIRYNGKTPDDFTAYFNGNTSDSGGEYPLYDQVTVRFTRLDVVYTIDEFNNITENGIYLVTEGGFFFLGLISSEFYRYYTIIDPLNCCMLTRTTWLGDNSVLEDYTNKFCSHMDSEGNVISSTYQKMDSNELITNAKSVVGAINEVAAKCIKSVTIKGGAINWTEEAVLDTSGNTVGYRYGQRVSVSNSTITEYSKVDLQISSEQAIIFGNKSLGFVAENDGGIVTVYCLGGIPEDDYTIQVTVTEVIIHE